MSKDEKKFLKQIIVIFIISAICLIALVCFTACTAQIQELESEIGEKPVVIAEEIIDFVVEKETGIQLDLVPPAK